MSGSNSFVFSAKRRGSNTPVVCKFFADQESFRREMKFFERVHTGDYVPGLSSPPHAQLVLRCHFGEGKCSPTPTIVSLMHLCT